MREKRHIAHVQIPEERNQGGNSLSPTVIKTHQVVDRHSYAFIHRVGSRLELIQIIHHVDESCDSRETCSLYPCGGSFNPFCSALDQVDMYYSLTMRCRDTFICFCCQATHFPLHRPEPSPLCTLPFKVDPLPLGGLLLERLPSAEARVSTATP